MIEPEESEKQASAYREWCHAKYHQVDSVDPKQRNKMVKVDMLVADMRDKRDLTDEIGE